MTEKKQDQTSNGQHRITVNMTMRGKDDLDFLVTELGDNQTDIIRQAVKWYRKLREIELAGGEISVRLPGENAPIRVWFM